MSGHILLIEDDPDIIRIVKGYLEQSNYQVEVARDGINGLTKALAPATDLVLLDWNLPGLDGLELLRRLRNERRIPVIMITARTEEIDRVMGLEFGADDYLTKPFSVRELVARVRAVLRRTRPKEISEELKVGPLTVDPARREATLGGNPLELTTLEFDLLLTLVQAEGRVFTRDDLLSRVWGDAFAGVDRVVDVHRSNLRKKLEGEGGSELLQTVRGVGYKLAAA